MKEEYNKINTPEELLTFMDKYIKYGIKDEDGNTYEWNKDSFKKACLEKWHLKTPEEIMNSGYGHCFDQTEIEKKWFQDHNYEYKTFFIIFEMEEDNPYPCHTYLVYKDKKSETWNWFEHADIINKGIHKFNTIEEAIEYQRKRTIAFNKIQGLPMDEEIISTIHIYEYQSPKVGSNQLEFITTIVNKGKDITNELNITEKQNKR